MSTTISNGIAESLLDAAAEQEALRLHQERDVLLESKKEQRDHLLEVRRLKDRSVYVLLGGGDNKKHRMWCFEVTPEFFLVKEGNSAPFQLTRKDVQTIENEDEHMLRESSARLDELSSDLDNAIEQVNVVLAKLPSEVQQAMEAAAQKVAKRAMEDARYDIKQVMAPVKRKLANACFFHNRIVRELETAGRILKGCFGRGKQKK